MAVSELQQELIDYLKSNEGSYLQLKRAKVTLHNENGAFVKRISMATFKALRYRLRELGNGVYELLEGR